MSAFSAFKSPSTAISIVALVMASTGGAFAAGHASAPSLRTVTESSGSGQAVCPAGWKVTGGGYVFNPKDAPVAVTGSNPVFVDPTHQGWDVDAASGPVTAYAVCSAVR